MPEPLLPYVEHLTVEQLARIQRLVATNRTIDDAWLEYAQEFGWGASGGDPVESAKKSIRSRLAELQRLLCQDAALGKVAASPATGATIALASVITGKLVASHFGGLDVVQLGVLLAQVGLLSICKGDL